MSDQKANELTLAAIVSAQQKGRPTYFDDPAADRALALLLEVAEELCVAQDRLDTIQKLVAQGTAPTDHAIDAFELSSELEMERLEGHRTMFEGLLRRLSGSRTL